MTNPFRLPPVGFVRSVARTPGDRPCNVRAGAGRVGESSLATPGSVWCGAGRPDRR